jgi:hypothetical protein
MRLRWLLPIAIATLCVGIVHHGRPEDSLAEPKAELCPGTAKLVRSVDPYGYRREHCAQELPDGRNVAEGPWTAWHPSGVPSAHGEMHDGRQVGVWTFWNPAGEVIESIDFGS